MDHNKPPVSDTDADDLTKVLDVLDGGVIGTLAYRTQIKFILGNKGVIDLFNINISQVIFPFEEIAGMLKRSFITAQRSFSVFLADQGSHFLISPYALIELYEDTIKLSVLLQNYQKQKLGSESNELILRINMSD